MAAPKMTVVLATRRDLRALAKTSPEIATSALAAAALALAREIDGDDASASGKASCARELRAVMSELRDRALKDTLRELRARASERPKEAEADGVTQLASRRSTRRARKPAS